MKILFGKRKSISEDETFVTLIRVAQEDVEVRKQLLSILSLDSFNRKSALNSFINEMRLRKAPKDFVAAIANLLDDAVAEKALEVIHKA